jgi:hypothetical protein
MGAGKYTEEQKAVVSIYNPQIDELKCMVRIALGKEASNDYKPPGINNDDGSAKKSAADSNEQPKPPHRHQLHPLKCRTRHKKLKNEISKQGITY